jgi:hypothetical protein
MTLPQGSEAIFYYLRLRRIEQEKRGYPNAHDFIVREEVEINGAEAGELCYIEFEEPKDGENEVYVFVKKDTARIFDDVPSLLFKATIRVSSDGLLRWRTCSMSAASLGSSRLSWFALFARSR